MGDFAEFVLKFCRRQRTPYDLIHANFWMSGLVAAEVKRALELPFVITFHALGRVRRLHQGDADTFPDERFAIEDRVVAEADHIIAIDQRPDLALAWTNLQASHSRCNRQKGTKAPESQGEWVKPSW